MNQPNQGCDRKTAGCISILSGYLALCLLGWAIVSLKNGLIAPGSADWPSTRGEVTVSTRVQDDDERKDQIIYIYHVNDREYTADRLSFQPRSLPPDLRKSASRLARFPVGTRVTVYYNPDDPQVAVLYPGQGNGLVGYTVAILFLLASGSFGALGLMLFSRTKQKARRAERSPAPTSAILYDSPHARKRGPYQDQRLRRQLRSTLANRLKNPRFRRTITFLVLGYALLVAIVLYRQIHRASQSAHWPSTSGEVIVPGPEDKELITYEYYVLDQSYRSGRISFGDATSPAERDADITALYPVGTAVTVYYNPEYPESAILFPGNGYTLPNHLSTALLILVAYIVCLYIPYSQVRRD